jgi:tetratricopeptide (TPR) repeat protein
MNAQIAGDYVTAAALFSGCLAEKFADAALTEFHIGWCLENAKDTRQATDHYDRAIQCANNPALVVEALFRQAWILVQEQEMDRAQPLLARLLSLADIHTLANATIEHAYFWFAVCLENDGRIIEAAARYEAVVLHANPDLWHEAAYRRMLCLSQIGDFSGALAAAETFLAASPSGAHFARVLELQRLARDEQIEIARARAAA